MPLMWSDIVRFATKFRHELHANPENTWQEFNTAAKIRKVLHEHGISYKECAKTGTVAVIGDNDSNKNIALRADIDALPITEDTDLVYKSSVNGCMHACGHDGHSATLLAVAIYLKQMEHELTNKVTLIFQPAEEGGHGAKKMIEEGCLEGIDYIFGWHNWPAIKFGEAACPDGVVMAANGTFHIDLYGVGGHSSQPELCKDPVLAGSAVVNSLQQIVSRRVAPQDSAVVTVTSFEAPSNLTTIPGHARLEGSIRISDTETRDNVGEMIKDITENTAAAYGVTANVELRTRYGATINNPEAAGIMRNAIESVIGKNWRSNISLPIMASEDFSYYLEKIPGAYALIGADDGEGHNIACHNAGYDFNDKLIEPVSKILIQITGLNNKQ